MFFFVGISVGISVGVSVGISVGISAGMSVGISVGISGGFRSSALVEEGVLEFLLFKLSLQKNAALKTVVGQVFQHREIPL